MCTAACKRRETIALELICCQWLGIGIYAGSVPICCLCQACALADCHSRRERKRKILIDEYRMRICAIVGSGHTHSEHNHFTIRLHLNAHKWRVSTAAVRFQSYNIIRTHVRWKSNRPNEHTHTQRAAAHVVRLLCGIQMSANWALTVGLDKFCIHHSFGSHKRRRLVSPLYLSISLSLHILDAHFAQWTMDGSAKLLQILYLNENWIQF